MINNRSPILRLFNPMLQYGRPTDSMLISLSPQRICYCCEIATVSLLWHVAICETYEHAVHVQLKREKAASV